MRVALIDSGLDVSRYQGVKVDLDLVVGEGSLIRERRASEHVLTDHGTTCAAIIAKYAPGATFCSLQIFDSETLRAVCDNFVAALQWCYDARIPLVHLSVGTSLINDYWRIRPIVAKMICQRQVIVAACSNNDRFSIPACIGGVLSVKADTGLVDEDFFVNDNSAYGLFSASSYHSLVLTSGNEYITDIANSFAAPTITAAVHNIMSGHKERSMSVPELLRALLNRDYIQCFHKPDFISDAVIFNPHGHPIMKQHLFFTCNREYEGFPNTAALEEGCDAVYLSDSGTDKYEDTVGILKFFDMHNCNLLYAGALPPDADFMDRTSLTWCEGSPGDVVCVYTSDELNVEFPIVNIMGYGLAPMRLMCELRALFIADDYQCVCLCDYPFSYLYGFDHIPDNMERHTAVSFVAQAFTPDVLICCFKDDQGNKSRSDDEYYITLTDYDHDTSIDQDANHSYTVAVYDVEAVPLLYKKITEYFLIGENQ